MNVIREQLQTLKAMSEQIEEALADLHPSPEALAEARKQLAQALAEVELAAEVLGNELDPVSVAVAGV